MYVRAEKERDRESVRAVNESAFDTQAEARLVDALRDRVEPLISLVAEESGAVVGHIPFSPVSLAGYSELNFMGLAPSINY